MEKLGDTRHIQFTYVDIFHTCYKWGTTGAHDNRNIQGTTQKNYDNVIFFRRH